MRCISRGDCLGKKKFEVKEKIVEPSEETTDEEPKEIEDSVHVSGGTLKAMEWATHLGDSVYIGAAVRSVCRGLLDEEGYKKIRTEVMNKKFEGD